MNKATKIIVIIMLVTILLYTIVGISKKVENERNNILSGDVINSGDTNMQEDEVKIYYEVSSGENEVILTGTSEGTISTTKYIFENEKLTEIVLTENIISGDDELVENIYNYMKTDKNMSEVYSSIERNGNLITAILKKEYVDAYGTSTKMDIYDELINSLSVKK